MRVNHSFNIPDKSSMSIGDTDIQHPTSMSIMTRVDNMNIMVSAFPGTVDTPETICMSVFIDGKQFVVFNGTKADAVEFFNKFPRN